MDENLKDLAEGLYLEDYISAQKDQVEQKLKNEQLIRSYRSVMATPQGRDVIWDILTMCRVFNLSMTGNSWTYFNEGGRQIGLYVLSMLNLGDNIEDIEKIKKLKPGAKDG